jgi:hypothetical protein
MDSACDGAKMQVSHFVSDSDPSPSFVCLSPATSDAYRLSCAKYNSSGTLENILINGWSTAIARAQFILGSESYLGSKFFLV